MYDKADYSQHTLPEASTAEDKATGTIQFQFSGSIKGDIQRPVLLDSDIWVAMFLRQPKQLEVREHFRALAARLCEKHKGISTDKRIFKGMPHIKGMRLAVGHVLANLSALGSVDAVVDAYAPYVSREQVREAIAYAKDFLEEACAPTPPHANG